MYSLLVACGAEGVRISFETAAKPVSFEIEIAKTPAELDKGLMNRKSLRPNAGMLFIFPDQQMRAFWMKDTLIPLDMIFMDAAKKIVGIVHGATPKSLDPRAVDAPAQYVLEINGGLAKQKGLKIGQQAAWKL